MVACAQFQLQFARVNLSVETTLVVDVNLPYNMCFQKCVVEGDDRKTKTGDNICLMS